MLFLWLMSLHKPQKRKVICAFSSVPLCFETLDNNAAAGTEPCSSVGWITLSHTLMPAALSACVELNIILCAWHEIKKTQKRLK